MIYMFAVAEISLTLLMATLYPASATTPLAQNTTPEPSDRCRRTSVQTTIAVLESPDINSSIVGTLPRGSIVTIENPGKDGWVPITDPFRGYVNFAYLTTCGSPTAVTPVSSPPTSLCRTVVAPPGLQIRQTPSTTSLVVGTLANGQSITIENQGQNGWVPITAPIPGFVSANYLKLCS